MAHFYGTLTGSRGEATRMGTKGSGMTTVAASWNGGIEVVVWHDAETGEDHYTVKQVPWHGAGVNLPISTGIVGRHPAPLDAGGSKRTMAQIADDDRANPYR